MGEQDHAMKKRHIWITLPFLLLPMLVQADRDTYIGLRGAWVDNRTDGAPGGFLALGWHFPSDQGYRISTDVEVEIGYWKADDNVSFADGTSKVPVKNVPVLANMRLHVPLADSIFNIYGGGGLGFLYMDVKGNSPTGQRLNSDSITFAYNFFIGLSAEITDDLLLHAGYRGLWQDKKGFSSGDISGSVRTYRNDVFEAGVAFRF